MKNVIIFILVVIIVFSYSQNYNKTVSDTREVKTDKSRIELISRLKHSETLKKLLQVSRDIESTEDEKENAIEEMRKAKEIIPEIYNMIEPGKSIWDYPGLITKGDIIYVEGSNYYTLFLGVLLRRGLGDHEYFFRVYMDDNGIILEKLKMIPIL